MTAKLTEEEKERRKQQKLLIKYRSTVCPGCRYSRYNHKSDGNKNDAPTTGEGCWYLKYISKNKCPQRS